MKVGIEPITDKNGIVYGYRLLEPMRRPCITCGHEADYADNLYNINQTLFDRWYKLQSELLEVNRQLGQIHNTSARLYSNNPRPSSLYKGAF